MCTTSLVDSGYLCIQLHSIALGQAFYVLQRQEGRDFIVHTVLYLRGATPTSANLEKHCTYFFCIELWYDNMKNYRGLNVFEPLIFNFFPIVFYFYFSHTVSFGIKTD